MIGPLCLKFCLSNRAILTRSCTCIKQKYQCEYVRTVIVKKIRANNSINSNRWGNNSNQKLSSRLHCAGEGSCFNQNVQSEMINVKIEFLSKNSSHCYVFRLAYNTPDDLPNLVTTLNNTHTSDFLMYRQIQDICV